LLGLTSLQDEENEIKYKEETERFLKKLEEVTAH